MTTPTLGIVCEADREKRKITFYVREGFGDGMDAAGLLLSNSGAQEKDAAIKIFSDAIDVIVGKKYSAVPVEKWATIRGFET